MDRVQPCASASSARCPRELNFSYRQNKDDSTCIDKCFHLRYRTLLRRSGDVLASFPCAVLISRGGTNELVHGCSGTTSESGSAG